MKLQKTIRIFTDKHLENLGNVFEKLYKDSLLTDCVLYCKDGSIKAHKVILAASSRYFKQIFIDHADDNAIFMYGISYIQLKSLVELIYSGSIDVQNDDFISLYGLLEELNVNAVVADSPLHLKTNGVGRDTRFKGQKRVAVDFESKNEPPLVSPPKPSNSNQTETKKIISHPSELQVTKVEDISDDNERADTTHQNTEQPIISVINIDNIKENEQVVGHQLSDGQEHGEHLSVWAKKERKFKCDLCPSSFKRASHLSRHQLVHTGERPFACNQCDKAFSRHDKLKHHIQKAHEFFNDVLGPEDLYTIDRVDILTPETNMVESSNPILTNKKPVHNISLNNSMDFGEPPLKKGRGRPRKYPALPKPLIKRPRGRPRINPVVAPPLVKRPRGRPRNTLIEFRGHDYQPFEDMHFDFKSEMDLGSSSNQSQDNSVDRSEMENNGDLHERGLMEPLVEIKTELIEKPMNDDEQVEKPSEETSFFEKIGLFENNTAIGKIGECTISVAPSSSTSTPNIVASSKEIE